MHPGHPVSPLARLAAFGAAVALLPSAFASFHLMQVEQVVGSLNGNPAAQAVQLRMRSAGQEILSAASLWVADAAGSNRVLLLNMATNVSAASAGSRILLTTPAFITAMLTSNPAFVPDFTLANAIPASYLAAGRLLFEQDGGTVAIPGSILWSVSWGGAAYTGSNTGSTTNDSDGNFGPAFAQPLPTTGAQGILFTGLFSAASTTNAANYALSLNPATVTRNNGTSYTLPLVTALQTWRMTFFGTTANSGNAADTFDFDHDGLPNLIEFAYGLDPTQNSAGQLPQPQRTGENFVVSFPQPAGVSGITYGVESTTSLSPANWAPVSDTGTGGQHLFSAAAAGVPRMFLRLTVTNP